MMRLVIQIGLLALWLGAAAQETTVFTAGEGGYACFRIPAIVKAPNGDLLAFCEARRSGCSDHGDVRIVMKSSRDNGETWGKMSIVAENGQWQAGNAAPVFDLLDDKFPEGRLFLFYNTGTDASEQEVREGKAKREVWYKTAVYGEVADTLVWSKPVNITPFVSVAESFRSYANTPGHALQLTQGTYRGRIFVPANHSSGPPQPVFKDYKAHGFYSDDHGQTWRLTPGVPWPGSNESTAAETSNGGLLMNIRNQSGDVRCRIMAISATAGAAWDTVYLEKQLPDPVCEGSMLNYTTPTGQPVILFSNLNHTTRRENLVLWFSADDGQTWQIKTVICAGSAAYSDLVVQQDNSIGVLYEREEYRWVVYRRLTW